MVSVYHAFSFSFLQYLIPLYCAAVPFIVGRAPEISVRKKDLLSGFTAALLILFPFWILLRASGWVFTGISLTSVLFQLFVVALPEEVYFRGFFQELCGNSIRSIIMVSILFTLMHVPRLVFYGDYLSLLTFFPSVVMGILYWMTSSITPPIIFHGISNILFLSMQGGRV